MTDWDPPACPEDLADARFVPPPDRIPTPAQLADAEAVETGSVWRTTQLASVVVAKRYGNRATLALLEPGAPPDRYTLPVGTRLRLCDAYEPSRDPRADGLDVSLYYGYFDGRGYRAYEIVDGPAAGRRVELPAGDGNFWMPRSSVAAHISLVPVAAEPDA